MGGLRFIVAAFLLAGIVQIHGLKNIKLKDVVQGFINTQRAPAPDSNIKGRLLTPEEGCGMSRIPIKRIVSGTPAKKGAWPWAAVLGQKDDKGIAFKCAGSLITSRHILTAARCNCRRCKNQSVNFVRLGALNISRTNDRSTKDVEIDRFVAHPEYDFKLHLNDIAIVHLKNDVQFTDLIRPVCLPVYDPIKFRNFDDSNPFLIDWGLTSHGDRHSDVLLQDQVVVHDKKKCKKEFDKYGKKRVDAQYGERIVCAGIEAETRCQYDAGGALMMPVFQNQLPAHQRFPIYQIGVTTFGYSCIGHHTPGIYASVQYFADWIIDELKK